MRSIDDIDEDEPAPIVVAKPAANGASAVMDDLFGPASPGSGSSPIAPSSSASATAAGGAMQSDSSSSNHQPKKDALDDFFGGGKTSSSSNRQPGQSGGKQNDVFDALFAAPSASAGTSSSTNGHHEPSTTSSSSTATASSSRPAARSANDQLDAFSAVMSGGAAPWTSTTSVAAQQAVGDRVFVPPDSVLSLMTLYDVVGAAPNWATEDIAKAYKKKALALHPDKLQGGRTEQEERYFKIITAAYEVLKDAERRAEYDAALKAGSSSSSSASWLNFVS